MSRLAPLHMNAFKGMTVDQQWILVAISTNSSQEHQEVSLDVLVNLLFSLCWSGMHVRSQSNNITVGICRRCPLMLVEKDQAALHHCKHVVHACRPGAPLRNWDAMTTRCKKGQWNSSEETCLQCSTLQGNGSARELCRTCSLRGNVRFVVAVHGVLVLGAIISIRLLALIPICSRRS